MNVKNRHLWLVYILFRVILDALYISYESKIYGYMGNILEINIYKLVASYILLLFMLYLLPKSEKKVSYLILQLHFIVMIIPMTTVYGLSNYSTKFMLMLTFVFSIQNFIIRLKSKMRVPNIKHIKLVNMLIILSVSGITYAYLLAFQQVNISAFNFNLIYDIREESSMPVIIEYFLTWQYRIINPIFLVLAFVKKRRVGLILVSLAQVLIYLMYPHKEVIFAIGYLVFILFLYSKRINFAKAFLVLLSAVSVLTSILITITNQFMPYAIIPSRLLYGPAKIKFQHYDFFSLNEKLYFSEGLVGKLLKLHYPYDVQSGYVVGLANGFNSNSNTGYLAYAYDNLGFVGMIIMGILFVLILKWIDAFTSKLNPKLVFAFIAYPMLILNDGDILTSLVTGGLFIIIFILLSANEFVGEFE